MSCYDSSETDQISRIRRFNRYYTALLGLLRSRYLGGPVGYGEARVLFELGRRPGCRAVELGRDLGLDRGYLSRLLASLFKRALISKKPDPTDLRSSLLDLTPKGRTVWEDLNRHSDGLVRSLLAALPVREQAELVRAMDRIVEILESREQPPE